MLNASRIYSFLDHKRGFNIHFLEGQKLVHDLALSRHMQGQGFSYFRDTFLGLTPIIFFLKPGESLGIYIDSEEPYFRLKIETNSAGHTRTLLLPEMFNLFPEFISGQVRITKIFQNNSTPYTSIIDLKNVASEEVINKILSESYQTNSEVLVSQISDQSILVNKLPEINVNVTANSFSSISRKEFILKNSSFFNRIFKKQTDDIEVIVKYFEDEGFSYLGSRQVSFYCPCSKERMILNLKGLYSDDIEELFHEKLTIETKCDYCLKTYQIERQDLE